MIRLARAVLAISLAMVLGAPLLVRAQGSGVLQVAPELERRPYEESTDALLTYFWPLMYEIDQLPDPPSPEQIKASPIRSLLLNYMLMMDLHAFVYEPGLLDAFRTALSGAYDEVGKYRDLLDSEALSGKPADSRTTAVRLARMNFALAPLRFPSFREDTKEFAYSRATAGRVYLPSEIPRIWDLAGARPLASLDDAGNAAMVSQKLLLRLVDEGIQVDDVLVPEQEDRFRDVRRTIRSVVVITDMYPSLSQRVSDSRDSLAELVDAYGAVNDALAAYKYAVNTGLKLDDRKKELRDRFDEADDVATSVVKKKALQDFSEGLAKAMSEHTR